MNRESVNTVNCSIDGALAEDHDVLSERAGLVREDELDLTKLLIQGGGASYSCSVCLTVVHLNVPVYEETVTKPQNFHTEEEKKLPSFKKLVEFCFEKLDNLQPLYLTYNEIGTTVLRMMM